MSWFFLNNLTCIHLFWLRIKFIFLTKLVESSTCARFRSTQKKTVPSTTTNIQTYFFTTFWSQAFRWPQKWIFPLRSQHRCFTITTGVLSRDIEIEVNTWRGGEGDRWFVRNLLKKWLFFCLNTSCQYSLQIIIKIYTFFTQVRKIHSLNVYEHNFEAI